MMAVTHSKKKAAQPPSDAKLLRAMNTAVMLIERYEGTRFEIHALEIFERIEAEMTLHQQRQDTKQRAQAWLKRNHEKAMAG